jgi:hypothetical protein
MSKTYKDKPKPMKRGRSHIPPPSQIHDDKRKKTRAQEKVDLKKDRRELDDENRTDRLFTQFW